MAARFAGRFLESVAREGSESGPGINLNYKFHRTMARAEEGPLTREREGDRACWTSAESINLIYLPFIRPSVAPPDVDHWLVTT
jgi:hypothetical protein